MLDFEIKKKIRSDRNTKPRERSKKTKLEATQKKEYPGDDTSSPCAQEGKDNDDH
jgi:hypothetical protein